MFFTNANTGFVNTSGRNTELLLKPADGGATWQEVCAQVATQLSLNSLFFSTLTNGTRSTRYGFQLEERVIVSA